MSKTQFFLDADGNVLADEKGAVALVVTEYDDKGEVVRERWIDLLESEGEKSLSKVGFIDPAKPRYRVFSVSELEAIKGFQPPFLVQKKYDGFQAQLQTDGFIYSGRGKNKTSQFKDVVKNQLYSSGKPSIFDAEALMYEKGQPLHRSMVIGYADSTNYDSEQEKKCIFEIYDVLMWNGENVRDKPLEERLKLLSQFKSSANIKVMGGEDNRVVSTYSGIEAAVRHCSGLKGSEGAMIKVLSAPYESPQNSTWAKIKKTYEIDVLVVDKKEQKAGTYNYYVAAGPLDPKCVVAYKEHDPEDLKEWKSQFYVFLGGTFNTGVEANIGDIIRIDTIEVNKRALKQTGCFTYGVFHPRVLANISDEKPVPDRLSVLDSIASFALPLQKASTSTLDEEYDSIAEAGVRLPDRFYKFNTSKPLKFVLHEHKPGETSPPMPHGTEPRVPSHGETGFQRKDWSDSAREAALDARRVSGGISGSRAEYSIDGGAGRLTAHVSGDTAEISTITVNPELRGKGIGSSLLNVSESKLQDAGVKEVRIRAVSGSENFWEKRGYSQYAPKPEVSGLPEQSARAKLELWRSMMSKPLKKSIDTVLKFRDHLDLRMEIREDGVIWHGYTPHPPQEPTVWDVLQQRFRDHRQIQCAAKSPCTNSKCMDWFKIGTSGWDELPAGEPGASTIRTGLLKIRDSGTYELGTQRDNMHEYFMKGDTLKGKVVFRRLDIGGSRNWYMTLPEDQMPLKPWEHEDSGEWRIKGAEVPQLEKGLGKPEHADTGFVPEHLIRSMSDDLTKLYEDFKTRGVSKREVLADADIMFQEYSERIADSAKLRLAKQLKRKISVLPPELQSRLTRMAKEYHEDFKKILDDWETHHQ